MHEQVVGIREHELHSCGPGLVGRHGLERAVGADGHERRRVDGTVRRGNAPDARCRPAGLVHDLEAEGGLRAQPPPQWPQWSAHTSMKFTIHHIFVIFSTTAKYWF